MKIRSLYILLGVVVFSLTSCSEDRIENFHGKPAIFMGVVMENPNRPIEENIDTLRKVSLGFTDFEEVTVNFIARLQGLPVDYDRAIKVALGGDALKGSDYELDENVLLGAGEHYALVPCRIIRNESMVDVEKTITLTIVGDEMFEEGDITIAYIVVEDGIPSDWVNGWGAEQFFGPCSREKYIFFYDFMGYYDLAEVQYGDYQNIANYLNRKIDDYDMNPEKYDFKYGDPPLDFRFEYVYEPF